MSWEESSEVTKVPLAESRRLLVVMESKSESACMERKDRKKMAKCGERQKEKSNNSERNAHQGSHGDGATNA